MTTVADPLATVIPLGGGGVLSVPTFERHGDDFTMTWGCPPVTMLLTRVRERREGPQAEVVFTHGGVQVHHALLALLSTSARETVAKKLMGDIPNTPWRLMLERACSAVVRAAREGAPLITLTGRVRSATCELLPRLLYEGQPTMLYADGDTGKSLVGLTVCVAMQSGSSLPFGLKPARTVISAYLDWETDIETVEGRLAALAAGLGVRPPEILYKAMSRPLVEEAATLAAEFARRRVGLVVIDSKMFAVAGGEGAAFHEPITAFYNALRLFAPAASLVLNHVTNADARNGGPARPFGGAFAFNGPRLIWEAKRDRDITDATAIAFTCRKANNLPNVPEPFGLRFVPGVGTITVEPLNLADTAPDVTASASITYRVRLALARGLGTPEAIAKELPAKLDTVTRTLRRLRKDGKATETADGVWELVARISP